MSDTPETDKQTANPIGRNEPCPCGSGKKYKRCCLVHAAPKLGAMPSTPRGGMPGGADLEQFKDQMDPQMMLQFSQMLGRLPKGQLQKLQNLMQRAMAGKDVAREAQEFERTLPPELQSLLQGFQMPGMPGMPGFGQAPAELPTPNLSYDAASGSSEPNAGESDDMNEEDARRIVEAAAKEGKISAEEAELLLQPKGISKLWKKFSRK